MAFDNFTPTTVRATSSNKERQPGEVFTVTKDVADVLASVGAVEILVDEPKHAEVGRYKRRDLRVEE